MTMKRFAARRIYLAREQKMLDFHVVELDERGIVRTVFPLREETSHTEWGSGIIVIAPGFLPRLPGETFADYADRLCSLPFTPLHAARIAPFNLAATEFTPRSRVIPLVSPQITRI